VETQGIGQYLIENPDECNGIRRFVLVREHDLTGVSGIGIVAEGAMFSGGLSVMRWLREPHSIGLYHSISDLITVHGHGGATQVQFIDTE